MDVLISNVDVAYRSGEQVPHQDILIVQDRIAEIGPAGSIGTSTGPGRTTTGPGRIAGGDVKKIDGRGFAALPTFKNAHTHAAMTLLRGYADDMKLQPWLETKIWPAEAQMSADDIYWGTRHAAVEMIKSGTTFANDMYLDLPAAWNAFVDSGIKAAVGLAMFDFHDPDQRKQVQAGTLDLLQKYRPGGPESTEATAVTPWGPVYTLLAPHSIYTCSGELLRWVARSAAENDLLVHIHMSETEFEVNQALEQFGKRPFHYADELGLLTDKTVVAHAIWLDQTELSLLGSRQVTVVHNPASNMKLSSGAFPFAEFNNRNVPMMLAPDGVASNNNLDMFDEMKIAALLQKHHTGDPTRMTAQEILDIAIGAKSTVFPGISGRLEPGEPADLMLVDLNHPQMVPLHNLASNMAYAGNGGAVDTVICCGKVLMEHREVAEETRIRKEVQERAEALVTRAGGADPDGRPVLTS